MENKTRPRGISILRVLHLVGGIILAIILVPLIIAFKSNPEASEAFAAMGMSPIAALIAMILLCVITIASGVTMWKGIKWGWYLGSFYYLYSVFRSISALMTVPLILSQAPPEQVAHPPSYYYTKFTVRSIIHLLIYLYFFKSNVRDFFNVSEIAKWKPVLIEIGVCLAISGIFQVISMLY